MHRIADAAERRASLERSVDRSGALEVGQHVLHAHVADLEIDAAGGRGAAGVEAGVAGHRPVGHGEFDGVQEQQPMVQRQVQADGAERHPRAGLHCLGLVADVRVHGPDAAHVEGRVGQDVTGGGLRMAGGLLLTRRLAGLRPAEQGAQVGEIEAMRTHVGLQEAAVLQLFEGHQAVQVAVADAAGEIGDLVGVLLADHVAGQAVGRAVGQDDAGQQIKVGQIAAGHRRGGL